jgi:hypothetical protein
MDSDRRWSTLVDTNGLWSPLINTDRHWSTLIDMNDRKRGGSAASSLSNGTDSLKAYKWDRSHSEVGELPNFWIFTFSSFPQNNDIAFMYIKLQANLFISRYKSHNRCTLSKLAHHHCNIFPKKLTPWRESNSDLLFLRRMQWPLRHAIGQQ